MCERVREGRERQLDYSPQFKQISEQMVMFVMERNNGNKRTCSGLLLLNTTRQSVREWKMVYKTGGGY